MTTLWIIGMWVVVIAGMYVFSGAMFWLFAQAFGLVDNYLQDRYWAKRGWKKMKDDSGQTWYVGYNE